MSKCHVCNTRKGKRPCYTPGEWICPQCCGDVRKEATCADCEFFTPVFQPNKYLKVPRYTSEFMSENIHEQSIAQNIESIIVKFDKEETEKLTDQVPLKAIEFLMDKYYFNTPVLKSDTDEFALFEMIDKYLKKRGGFKTEELVKVLGVLYFVLNRRSKGKREYLDFIAHYV